MCDELRCLLQCIIYSQQEIVLIFTKAIFLKECNISINKSASLFLYLDADLIWVLGMHALVLKHTASKLKIMVAVCFYFM